MTAHEATPAPERRPEPDVDTTKRATPATPPDLAFDPDVLAAFAQDLERGGHVGERGVACLVLLAAVSRRFSVPVSIAVKGPSAGGKSMTVERSLAFVRPSAYHALTAMSERALVYDTTPLKHRMLVIYE